MQDKDVTGDRPDASGVIHPNHDPTAVRVPETEELSRPVDGCVTRLDDHLLIRGWIRWVVRRVFPS